MASTVRRTQQERSSKTRSALVDAAIACLVDYGYSGTTTGLVCDRAGVSRGAYLHHFRTRAALVAAALAELAHRREEDFREQVDGLPEDGTRIEVALELLWAWFTEPLFYASVDLGVHAQTDAELRETLAPVERHLNHSTLERCRVMFTEDPADTSCDQLIAMTLAVVRGLALLPMLQPGSRKATQHWVFARGELATKLRECARPG
jgi:AcrR family transcriptional regulator